MKKLLILISILLLAFPAYSWAWGTMVISGGVPVSSGDTSCDNLGSYELYYDVDHSSGTTTACVSGGTETVTFTSVSADSSWDCTSGGTYGVLWDGACNKYVEIPATGLSTSSGYIKLSIKTPSTLAANDQEVFEWTYDIDNQIYLYIDYTLGSGYRLVAKYIYAGTYWGAVTDYKTLSTDTCYILEVYWDVSAGKIGTRYGGDLWSEASGITNAFSTPSNGVRFGEDTTNKCYTSTSLGFDDIYFDSSKP